MAGAKRQWPGESHNHPKVVVRHHWRGTAWTGVELNVIPLVGGRRVIGQSGSRGPNKAKRFYHQIYYDIVNIDGLKDMSAVHCCENKSRRVPVIVTLRWHFMWTSCHCKALLQTILLIFGCIVWKKIRGLFLTQVRHTSLHGEKLLYTPLFPVTNITLLCARMTVVHYVLQNIN